MDEFIKLLAPAYTGSIWATCPEFESYPTGLAELDIPVIQNQFSSSNTSIPLVILGTSIILKSWY